MTEEEFEQYWNLAASSLRVVGKLQSLVNRSDFDELKMPEVAEILDSANEVIEDCKKAIKEFAVM